MPNLDVFLQAKEKRQVAQKVLANTLGEALEKMTVAMTEETLDHTAGVIYEEQGERFEAHESRITELMKSNHSRRQQLTRQIEQANT